MDNNEKLFRGYVRTNGKAATESFKNIPDDKLHTFDDVRAFESFGGVLRDNVVLIDVDDFDESEKFLNIIDARGIRCRVYETRRGKHFYFYNDGIEKNATGALLACGIHADIKTGARASYGTLKIDGAERPIIYDIFDGEDFEPVPRWAFPVKSKINFAEMESGDGRNQSLFNYILTLQSAGFSKDDARDTLQIINDFVLSEPLPQNELDTLSRDDAFKKPVFFKGNTFLFDKFAAFMISEHHIIRIDDRLHIYDEGVYKSGDDQIEAAMIKHIPNLTKSRRSEVMAYIELLCIRNRKPADAKFICFNNGVYDLESGELKDFDPDIIITNKICWNYNPDAANFDVDATLNRLAVNDPSIRALLEECVGYCFYRRNELRKSFILTGGKRNGKSTFLSMVENLLGRENITALDLGELGDRFKTAELFGKLANIGDDIGDDFISNPAVFKKLCSGNSINVERKGRDPFDFNNYAKLLFSANNIPRIKDKTGAVLDRFVIIPFNASFDKNSVDYDPYIKYKLETPSAMEYLIQIGLTGLRRVLNNYGFTESAAVDKQLQEYEEANNPIVLFFKDVDRTEIVNNASKDVYLRYSVYCNDNGFTALSNVEFTKKVKIRYNVELIDKRVNGHKCRVFVEG